MVITRKVEMQAKTEEAQSLKRQQILQLIPQFEIKPIFLREHLNREIVIGTVGDRGGGKSGSDAVTGIVDFLLAGKPVWSNMEIRCDIEIDNDTAMKYGLNYGGIAHFQSQSLEKAALLRLDETYRDGLLLIEEINVQYANARKALTNTNCDFNEVCQQLRKFHTSLIYNVIDEMFIDIQLRALTDVFLKTYDTAFDLDSLEQHKQAGLDFKWSIYPMSGYLAGEQGKYVITKKPLPPIFLHFGSWRGVFDTGHYQEKGTYSMNRRDKEKAALEANISVESSPEMVKHTTEWAWLAEAARDMKEAGQHIMEPRDLVRWLGRPITPEIRAYLKAYGIYYDRHEQAYRIEDFNLARAERKPHRDLVSA